MPSVRSSWERKRHYEQKTPCRTHGAENQQGYAGRKETDRGRSSKIGLPKRDGYEKVYEDNAVGKVTDEFFMQLSYKYEVERMELKSKITALKKRLVEMDSAQKGRDAFLTAIRKFMEMEQLTAPLLRELIDHIDVYETEGTDKSRTQRVVIHYRFAGYLELPENVFRQSYKADTRQGVSVEYLLSPVTA